jgi:hypothetical protein
MSWDTRRLFATRQAVKILVIEVHTLVLIILTHLKLLQVLDTKATPTQMGQLGYSYDNITLTIGVVPTGPSLNFYFPTPVAPTSHSCSPFSLTYSGEIYYVSYRTIIGIPNITKGNVIADVTATVTF